MSVKEDRVVESLLFSAGKPLSVEEIQETTGLSPKHVSEAIDHLTGDVRVITKACQRGDRASHAVV